jgi:hypothetical protein
MNYAQVQQQDVPLAANNSGISLFEDETQGHFFFFFFFEPIYIPEYKPETKPGRS